MLYDWDEADHAKVDAAIAARFDAFIKERCDLHGLITTPIIDEVKKVLQPSQAAYSRGVGYRRKIRLEGGGSIDPEITMRDESASGGGVGGDDADDGDTDEDDADEESLLALRDDGVSFGAGNGVGNVAAGGEGDAGGDGADLDDLSDALGRLGTGGPKPAAAAGVAASPSPTADTAAAEARPGGSA